MGVAIDGGSDRHCRRRHQVAVVVIVDIDVGGCYNPSLVKDLQGYQNIPAMSSMAPTLRAGSPMAVGYSGQ